MLENQKGRAHSLRINIASFILFVACCSLHGVYFRYTHNRKIQPKLITNIINQSIIGKDRLKKPFPDGIKEETGKNHSYIITRSVLTYTQRDIIESPTIEFLPQFKSACFHDLNNTRYFLIKFHNLRKSICLSLR